MTTFLRHTDGSHVVRPDRVYRTGVIPPLVGFSPEQDVMANANAFTSYPGLGGVPQLMGIPTLMGIPQLMGSPTDGPFKRMWLRFKANRLAKAFAKATGLGGVVPNGPAAAMAPQVVPMMAGRVGLLSMIAAKNFPSDWSDNALETIQNRWNGRRQP